MFVIRNQGYFYTDEYFAPDGGFARVLKQTYKTREEAEEATRAYNRSRMRKERLADFLFDDKEAINAVTAVMRELFPDAYDYDADFWFWKQEAHVPKTASDDQVDKILHASKLEFAKVFTYNETKDEAPLDPMMVGEIYYGPEAEEMAREALG